MPKTPPFSRQTAASLARACAARLLCSALHLYAINHLCGMSPFPPSGSYRLLRTAGVVSPALGIALARRDPYNQHTVHCRRGIHAQRTFLDPMDLLRGSGLPRSSPGATASCEVAQARPWEQGRAVAMLWGGISFRTNPTVSIDLLLFLLL